MKRRFLYFATLLFITFYNTYSQCAMCKAAAQSDLENNPHSFARGLNTGIIFLMVIPYIIVFIIFRKDISQFAYNIKHRENAIAISKDRISKLTFVLTFLTCAVLLFILFTLLYKGY